MKLLIVEDEFDLADLMKELFEDIDYKVTVCNDGEEGEYYATDYEFDAVILDIMLPGKDGWEILPIDTGKRHSHPCSHVDRIG